MSQSRARSGIPWWIVHRTRDYSVGYVAQGRDGDSVAVFVPPDGEVSAWQASRLLQVTGSTVRLWIREGKLPAQWHTGMLWIRVADVQRLAVVRHVFNPKPAP